MGRIFSFADVAAGRIPRPDDFGAVKELISREFTSADEIVAAQFCGSVVTGGFSERSDLDCLVIYRHEGVSGFGARLRRIHEAARTRSLPVEFIPIEEQVAKGPIHHIGPSFAQHLRYAASRGGLIKGNPIEMLASNLDTASADVRQYVQHKLRAAEKAIGRSVYSESERLELLQQIVDVPVHAARKMLRFWNVLPDEDSKRTVFALYRQHGSFAATAALATIIEIDGAYSFCLRQQIGEPERETYEWMLESIQYRLLTAYEFLRSCALELGGEKG